MFFHGALESEQQVIEHVKVMQREKKEKIECSFLFF